MEVKNDTNQPPTERIADDTAEEVLTLAARYSAEQQESYSQAELIQAIQQVEVQKQQATLDAQERKESRQLLFGIGCVLVAMTSGVLLLSYNALTAASERVDAAWAQVENQMQRRAELLPALLLIAQRQRGSNPRLVQSLQQAGQSTRTAMTTEEKIAASQKVDTAVAAFHTTFLSSSGQGVNHQELNELQDELIGTANRLAVERLRFNQAVEHYNRTLSTFPHILVARAADHQLVRASGLPASGHPWDLHPQPTLPALTSALLPLP